MSADTEDRRDERIAELLASANVLLERAREAERVALQTHTINQGLVLVLSRLALDVKSREDVKAAALLEFVALVGAVKSDNAGDTHLYRRGWDAACDMIVSMANGEQS